MGTVVAAVSLGIGLVLLLAWACSLRPTLVARVRPYVRANSRQIAATTFPSLGRALAQWAIDALATAGSSAESIEKRQRLAGHPIDVRRVRMAQLAWAGIGTALALTIVGALGGRLGAIGGILLVLFGAACGALGRDAWLSHQATRRQRALIAQVPDAAELLALAVGAGEAIGDAIARVAGVAQAPIGEELARVGALTQTGTPLTRALAEVAHANDCPGLTRLADSVIQAVHRGTPLGQILRDQALDERESARRDLMERAGHQEIAMLVPVVFGIMPITIIFALYPGLIALRFGV